MIGETSILRSIKHIFMRHLQRKSRGWYLLNEPVMRYWFIAMVLVAVYAPINVLDQVPLLRDLTNLMTVFFPPIGNFSDRSDFPQVTALYMSLSWLTSPLHGYYLLKEYQTDGADWVIRFKNPDSWPPKERIKGVATLVLILVVAYYLAFLAMGHDFNLLPINSSRYVLGVCGWIVQGGGVIALGIFGYFLARQLIILYR